MSKCTLLLCLLLMAIHANADRIVGNGGDLLICSDSKTEILTYELFDLYEARDLRNLSIDWPQKNISSTAIAKRVLERLSVISPRRSKIYIEWAREFKKETLFRKGISLENIDDSKHFYKPNNCEIKQVAVQLTGGFAEDPRYIVDEDLWLAMDVYQRAALITHEVIYREYVGLHGENSVDSRAVRYLNSLLWSNSFRELSLVKFTKLIQDMRFEYIEYRGVMIRVYSPEDDLNEELLWDPMYYDSGEMMSARVVDQQTFIQNGLEFILADQPDVLPWRNTISFYENGIVEKLVLWGVQTLNVNSYKLNIWGRVQFYSSGQVKEVQLGGPHELRVGGTLKEFIGKLQFSKEGRILID